MLILPMPGHDAFGVDLAAQLDAELGRVEARQFPDGEHYVRLACDVAGRDVLIVCTLARSDAVFLPLVFAADAARELGARRVTLVAPYLGYMRQDQRFQPGEAVSVRSFARLLSSTFDRLLTVDPHLHRVAALREVYTLEAATLHAAPLLSRWIRESVPAPLVIGPDAESEQWAAEVARAARAPHVVLTKTRLGDRDVRISFPDLTAFEGRQPVLIDDIASSGRTLVAAAQQLQDLGFAPPHCAVVHAIFGGDAYEAVSRVAGEIVSTDSVPHPSNRLALAPLFAEALRTSA
jgi:ribose-phosphate pyrophosphokinase